MKVVLLEDIPSTGLAGQIREVKNGFARNYLIPKGLAAPATQENLQRIKAIQQVGDERRGRELANWQELAQTLEGTTITIKANAGAEGRLFGSVTSANIASELSNEIGRGVDRRGVLLPQSIRELGSFNVPVRLFPGVELDVTVNVEATED